MIDIGALKYRVVVMDTGGSQYNITDFVQNLGWEENESEIAVHLTFTSRNDETSKGYLSDIIKPGCLIGVFASDGNSMDEEVARGFVESWNPVEKNSGSTLKCTCYDELYKLQKSQDNRYFSSGSGTKSMIQGILNDWEIPQGDYAGPDVTHGKMVYNNRYLSDMILDLLDDAVKRGGEKCMVRSVCGKVSILPRGSNNTVYVLAADNTKEFSGVISTENLITRVKVVGQAGSKKNQSVEAILDGQTEYGIRQRIYTRASDETLQDAKASARAILDDEGKIRRDMTVQAPDVPFIRKGDLVYIMSANMAGYYFVKSIQHDADTVGMSLKCEFASSETGGTGAGRFGKGGMRYGV